MASLKESAGAQLSASQEDVEFSVETPPNPERPRLKLTMTIALTGPESSGKGEVLKILQKRHGWKVFDGSEIGFKRKGEGPEKGHIKRSKKQHKAMDKRQSRIFRNLNPDSEHLVDEAKLSGIIKAEQADKRDDQIERIKDINKPRIQEGRKDLIKVPDPIPAVTILLWATQEARVNRAYNDANRRYVAHFEKYLEQTQLLMEGVKIPEVDLVDPPPENPPTKDMIEKLMKERQFQDTVDWAHDHPEYIKVGENPYSRYLRRPKNRGFVYDRWIDTTNLTPEEVADKFEAFALEMGAAEPLSFAELEALPQSGDIFSAEDLKNQMREGVDEEKKRRQDSPERSIEVKPDEMGDENPREPNTNGNGSKRRRSKGSKSSGKNSGEPASSGRSTGSVSMKNKASHPSNPEQRQNINSESAA